jgi:very-short-patch-repair endonuclease
MGKFGGELWDDAQRSGRIKPARGPNYVRRVYPMRVPVPRRQLLDNGMTRRALRRDCLRLTRSMYLPPLPSLDTMCPALRDHPRLGPAGHGDDHGRYQTDIVTRVRAFIKEHPGAVVGYWGAAAFHGLALWADSSPVVLLKGMSKQGSMQELPYDGGRNVARGEARAGEEGGAVKGTGDLERPVLRPMPARLRTERPDPAFPDLEVVDQATAAVDCLTTILSGKKTWHVPEIAGLDARIVRAVQFIDAFLQCTWVTVAKITRAAAGRISSRTLRRIMALVDHGHGAESPREPLLRLMIRDELPAGFIWSTQVTIDLGSVPNSTRGRQRTRPDIACPELKIALYYDGEHHRGAEVTDADFRLFQRLKDLGWEVVRVNREGMKERVEMMESIRNAIGRSVRAAGVV